MPSASRQAYFALRAFNVEIANIKDASRSMGRSRANTDNDDEFITADSSLASRLRIQWWKDGVSEVFGGNVDNESSSATSSDHILQSLTSSRKHNPVMRSVAHAIRDHSLTHRFLRRMIEAREKDLDVLQYEKLTDVAQYGEDTISSLLYLSLETVGVSISFISTDCIASKVQNIASFPINLGEG
jgi:NADH dehydrogenase [ubiquinone] 1 alpha subcomplex assembly factor 6